MHKIQTGESGERETQISNQTCLCFLMLIQTEVQWLEIIEMKQMSRGCCKCSYFPAAVIVRLQFQVSC